MADEIKDGGPAFPIFTNGTIVVLDYGMSLRDYFAGQAIAGTVGPAPDGWSISPQDQAAWAYQIADAMIAERERPR
jgi:hypothetical protein